MPVTLGTAQTINQLADLLYPFLPGKPHPYADPRISFRGVARDVGLGRSWANGSKLPAVTQLLSCSYEADKGRFATLVLEVVRRGLVYREGKDPIKREEIVRLYQLLLKLSLRIRELCDQSFLETLPGSTRRPTAHVAATPAEPTSPAADSLKALQAKLRDLSPLLPAPRGFAFERFLSELFEAFGLAPRGSFRLVGEQIDGSFHHAGQTYLAEAKWEAIKTGQADLLAFSGKVAGKAQWSRGAHISLTGYSDDGLQAFAAASRQTSYV